MYLSVAGLLLKKQNTLLSDQISSCIGCIAPFISALAVGPRQLHPTKYSQGTVHFINVCMKTNKYTNYSFRLLIMYGSSYMFWHHIAILRERS
jgi:hypothetical protein